MVKAKINLGELRVEIEGSSEEIREILEGVRRIDERKKDREERFKLWKERKEGNYERNRIAHGDLNLTELLEKIIKTNYFNEPRTAKEVLFRLEHDGDHVPPTTLHPILARLVMKGILKRGRNDSGIWMYRRS